MPFSGGFACFVAATSAPYDNRLACLPLPVPDFNRLECASFAWRTHFLIEGPAEDWRSPEPPCPEGPAVTVWDLL